MTKSVCDRYTIRAAAQSKLTLALVVRPTTSPPCLVVFRWIDYGLTLPTQVEWTDPIPMLEPALLVEVWQAVYDEVPADKVDLVACFIQILDEGIMIRQFRQP